MRNLMIAASVVGLVAFGLQPAHAATCSVNGTTFTCELTCGTAPCVAEIVGHTSCDSPLLGGNNDGWCTICGDGSVNDITGTSGKDVICGKGGNDTLRGDPTGTGAGDLISGDAGNDIILGRAGDDFIAGGSNDDNIQGGDGDDEIDGGDGVDTLSGDKGNDVVRGGDGADQVQGGPTFDETDIGDRLCGNKDSDLLIATGNGVHCLDGGPGQTSASGYDCIYDAPASPDGGDLATGRNCNDKTFLDDFHVSTRACNCQD